MIAPAVPPRRTEVQIRRERYAGAGPRYTSYPTVPYWDAGFDSADYEDALDEVAHHPSRALSVYVHIPFCGRRCWYCGCNAMVTHRTDIVDAYLDHLEAEIGRVVEILGTGRRVAQLHWGGGTPNFLDDAQTDRLLSRLSSVFALGDAEIGIELDPRIARPGLPAFLRTLGFTRVSLGVQDFDPGVQTAIGRLQSDEETVDLYEGCRRAGFTSVNLDLVYGLPRQTRQTFARTLDRILALGPDRIATFAYAHVPALRPNQRAIDEDELPGAPERLEMLLDAVERLEGAGWTWVGLDHFARADDELARAARHKTLRRTFMGYTTGGGDDLIAFGVSGIGQLAGRYVQNDASLAGYQRALDDRTFPIVRGLRMTRDDRLRARVIEHLMCNLEIPSDLTVDEFGIGPAEALPDAFARLAPLVDDGLVRVWDGAVTVTAVGRYYVRNIAMVFDAHLHASPTERPAFSATV